MNWFYHHWSRLIALGTFVGLFITAVARVGDKIPESYFTKGDLVGFFLTIGSVFFVGFCAGAEWYHERLHNLADEIERQEQEAGNPSRKG